MYMLKKDEKCRLMSIAEIIESMEEVVANMSDLEKERHYIKPKKAKPDPPKEEYLSDLMEFLE